MGKLAGKIAVITGGTSGIGFATAQRFVAEGAYVFITGRRQAELDAAVQRIGHQITGVQGDVASLPDLNRLYETLRRQQGHLDILFALNASTAASTATPAFSVYSATKAAVRSFARSWTLDLKHRRMRVNTLSPGATETAGLHGLAQTEAQAQELNALVSAIPLGRMAAADEIAKAAVFLASDDSSYVTGIELFVDGGMAQI